MHIASASAIGSSPSLCRLVLLLETFAECIAPITLPFVDPAQGNLLSHYAYAARIFRSKRELRCFIGPTREENGNGKRAHQGPSAPFSVHTAILASYWRFSRFRMSYAAQNLVHHVIGVGFPDPLQGAP